MSVHRELASLVAVSARVGQNLSLVQAGGGNTSLKDRGTLWIKASGKWLANAGHDDMFVPVPLAAVLEKLATGDERFPEYATRSGALLRPSVETTMHAVLPHRVVIHVHSVATIAWATRTDAAEVLVEPLAGLRWSFIPYIHPGVPLAQRIREELPTSPDVLVLGNHGLVVAGETCEEAERLLDEVEARLQQRPQPAETPDLRSLRALAAGTDWQPVDDPELNLLAGNPNYAELASGGTMYPDHCVYLGPAAPVAEPGEGIADALRRYTRAFDYAPGYLIVRNKGVLTAPTLSRAGRELLHCLKRVVERIPPSAPIGYIEDALVAKLMNWDAEKYRLAMARLEQ
jgi:rhamnose utilization protein RhaD (predicted bifunctional aldolase and dehydrogenase)